MSVAELEPEGHTVLPPGLRSNLIIFLSYFFGMTAVVFLLAYPSQG